MEGGSDASSKDDESDHLYVLRVIIPLGSAPVSAIGTDSAQADTPAAGPARERWAGSGLSVERRPEDLPATGFGLTGDTVREERYLQVLQPVPTVLARNADEVQRAYREYRESARTHRPAQDVYRHADADLVLAVFIAVMLALLLGGQLARPLLMLLQGTKEVAEGDPHPSAS